MDKHDGCNLQWIHILVQTLVYSMFICRDAFHTLSDTPWLVVISPWCFLGNTHWGSWSPVKKDREMLAEILKKTGTQKQTSMHTCSHTYWDRYGGCCFIEAPCCFYLCPRGKLPNASRHKFQNSSTALSCSIIYNLSPGQSCLSNLFSHAKGQANFVFSN